MKNKFVIIGCGRFGARIANESSRDGENVVVVDSDSTSFDRLNDDYSGYTISCDATDVASLEEDCYIKDAYRLLISTGDDNINLFLSHVALSLYDVPEIFVRFNDPSFSSLIDQEKIKAIYPFELSLKKFKNMLQGERK